jgi:hypothetical protein
LTISHLQTAVILTAGQLHQTETSAAKARRTRSFRKESQKRAILIGLLRLSLRFLCSFAALRWTFKFGAIALILTVWGRVSPGMVRYNLNLSA